MSTDSRFEQQRQQQVVEAQPNAFVEQAWGPQGRVPQEFQRRHHSGGDTVNIYIDHANINMGNGRPEFAGCDPHVRRVQDMRRIQYYDDMQNHYRNRDNYYCHQDRRQQWCPPPRYEQPPVYVRPPIVHVEPPQVYVRPPQVYVEPRYYEPTPRYYDPGPRYYPQQNVDVYQDSVHGGRDGYTSSRTRIQTNPGYRTYDPYGGGYSQRDDFDRMTDLGFGILDRVFANEANKRATRGQR